MKRRTNASEDCPSKKQRQVAEDDKNHTAGKIERIFVRNFMCHDAMEVMFNQNVNFIIGRNGSGKSAILTALTIGLGARAHITSRGKSVKEFIKKGKNSATIEISICNKGIMAFKPELYGEKIVVTRNIGASSTYKIKNWKGELITTKRDELNDILRWLNIQIENPISILNQDVSRTFLVASTPQEKYELFMRATRLDTIGNNYNEAEMLCIETKNKLTDTSEKLAKIHAEVQKLKKSLQLLEKVDELHQKVEDFQNELYWAKVIVEEKKLAVTKEQLSQCEESLKQYERSESEMGSSDEKIEEKIRELQEKIKDSEREVAESTEAFNKAKQEYSAAREAHNNKVRELRSNQNKTKRMEDNINLLRKEIHQLENSNNDEQNEQNRMKQRQVELEQKLDEVEAILRTKQTDKMHLDSDRVRLSQEINSARIEVTRCEGRIREFTRKISGLKQQSDNAFTVFGPNIPRLLKRIDEEYTRGRFKQKPHGPIGAYMKMKDPAWSAAVESYLGAGSLTTFCVDNSDDAKVLGGIMKEIFLHERSPQIISSKFYPKVHDVSRHCTRSPNYSNLLEAMDIDDPIVANCLIDQREIECVLLIPTGQEATQIMSDARNVPCNCKIAITQRGDIYYPDPNYRSYGQKSGLKARYLQVSTTEAIQALEEELGVLEDERQAAVNVYKNIQQKTEKTNFELREVNTKVSQLLHAQSEYKKEINSIMDKIQTNEETSLELFRNELAELEKKLKDEKSQEIRLNEEATALEQSFKSLEADIKRYKNLRQGLDTKIKPFEDEIQKLKNEKEMLHLKGKHATRKLQEARQALQNATAEYDVQQRVTDKAVTDATSHCPRIDTQRTITDIKSMLKRTKNDIQRIEQEIGSKEEIQRQLDEKQKKYGNVFDLVACLEQLNEKHMKRLQNRKKIFHDMKKMIGLRVQRSFSAILSLRKYKGTITIDHTHRALDLQVTPESRAEKISTDTKSLSGGERSYSTVAFILALWDCTGLPFYFLDEFDVFMDKVNRRVIMDILLDHTRTHPVSQFVFLTPLDTSSVNVDDGYITIHQLAPPERGQENMQ